MCYQELFITNKYRHDFSDVIIFQDTQRSVVLLRSSHYSSYPINRDKEWVLFLTTSTIKEKLDLLIEREIGLVEKQDMVRLKYHLVDDRSSAWISIKWRIGLMRTKHISGFPPRFPFIIQPLVGRKKKRSSSLVLRWTWVLMWKNADEERKEREEEEQTFVCFLSIFLFSSLLFLV